MRTLFASVFMKNKEYERALMVGICREYTGIKLYAVSEPEEAALSGINGILLTDADIYGSLVLKKEDIKGLPIRETVRKIASLYFDMTGEIFAVAGEDTPTVLEFYSRFGGSGDTSIAVTTARLLAASSERRVIYLNLRRYDDYEFYVDVDFRGLSSKRKFIYKIKKTSGTILIDEFIREDKWRVGYFCPQKGGNSFEYECDADIIIDYLIKYKDISYIVVDSYEACCDGGIQVEVINSKDLRNRNEEKKGLSIYNFSDDVGEEFHVPEDNESFRIKGDTIDISMTGKFISSIEEIVKYLKEKKDI